MVMVMVMEEVASSSSTATTTTGIVLPDAKNGAASMLVAQAADLMAMYLDAGILLNNPTLLTELCLSLANAIDHAIANNEVPIRSHDLPPLLKQVYGSPDVAVQVGLMMLTMSIQSACKLEWFANQDTDDLLKLSQELMKSFSDPEHIRIEPTHASSWVSKVMTRFYPNMKIDKMLFSLEVKPGCRFCVAGFPLSRGTVEKQDKIHLFVAQLDNLKTASCIITPPEVNFLLNGQAVEGRIMESMDKGPQLPTNVTTMLKYGVNCLQAIGQFNGNFFVVIAVMSNTQSSNARGLQDYVLPVALPTSEVYNQELPSRISLNCPISKSRIKTPVKGKLCKHPQCFDYDNFLEISLKRPSWQCPHCEQSVCYVDIRIDQNVVKVLREAEEKVVNVIMLANGSWKEDKDLNAEMYEDSQVRHQGGHHNHECSKAGRSTSLHTHIQTVSAAENSLPVQNISAKLLRSAHSCKAAVNNDSHDNSYQFLQKNSFLHVHNSGADTSSIRQPCEQQKEQHWSLPNLNTSETLNNTEKVVNDSVPVPMQLDERDATMQAPNNVHQAAQSPRVASFHLATSRTNSRLNSPLVFEEQRSTNEQLQQVIVSDIAASASKDWRPSGRMRGSLTGEVYDASFHQFMIQPTLRAQASRLPSNLVPTPSNAVSSNEPLTNAAAASHNSQAYSHQAQGDPTNLSGN